MLKVSRPDINVDTIVDYNVEERFIKLPIVPYLKLLNLYDTINRPQIALINAINDPRYRFICAALARRLGKTHISNVIGQLVCLIPGCDVLIMSPNYNLSSISFELQRKLIAHFDLEVARDNLKDKIIELQNGSTIRMGSIGTVDSSVGRSYNLIIFDEAALSKDGDKAFEQALRPTLDRPNSKAIFISTPRGKNNWFSLFFNRGFSSDYPAWCSIHADYTENTRMLASDVAEARKTNSAATFEQEYLASFVSFEGQIFRITDDNIADFNGKDGYDVIAGLDPGYKDPLGFVVIVYEFATDTYWIVDEYLASEVVTSKHAERIKELIAKWNIELIYIDPANAQFAADLAYTYEINTYPAKKDVLAGIATVQTLVEQRKLKIAPHCVETIKAFEQYQWDDKPGLVNERPKHDFSHLPDAVRYAAHTFVI